MHESSDEDTGYVQLLEEISDRYGADGAELTETESGVKITLHYSFDPFNLLDGGGGGADE